MGTASVPKGGVGIGPDEMRAWLSCAQPGDILEYWRGHLAQALDVEERRTSIRDPRPVRALADMSHAAYRRGRVELVQRREVKEIAYLAIATTKRRFG